MVAEALSLKSDVKQTKILRKIPGGGLRVEFSNVLKCKEIYWLVSKKNLNQMNNHINHSYSLSTSWEKKVMKRTSENLV